MDLTERIRRRRGGTGVPQLIRDYDALSPVVHVEEPSGCGPVFERLLDHLDPVFDGNLPPNGYLHGPFGSGKSAIVTSLFTHLSQFSTETRSMIHTSTRQTSPTSPEFVYVDRRQADSEFAFYLDTLDGLVDEQVPEHGISTAEIQDRIHDILDTSRAGVVIGVDHVDEPETTNTDDLVELFAGLPSNVSWLAVGRTDPQEVAVTEYTARAISVGLYQRQMLVDLLMTRASQGLAQQALDHDIARRIADWADGNAHDALAVLFAAAERATTSERSHLTGEDVTGAIEEMPRPSVSLGRVLALPANKQRVLRALADLDSEERKSVTATTDAISSRPDVDLSAGTVKRFLYEMAEQEIVERVQSTAKHNKGRPPSRVELRFPPTVFCRLYDNQQ